MQTDIGGATVGAKGVSIIICCYNSAKRLPKTLEHIALQNVKKDVSWEVIVIDNASTDNTSKVAIEEWRKHGWAAPLRVISQPVPGLSAARDMGFKEAAFEFVLMCDDDNWLNTDYVSIVFDIMLSDINIGALGGVGTEICEIKPPDWFNEYKPTFAVGKFSATNGDITNTSNGLYGAGCTIRKSAYMNLYENGFRTITSDRSGTKMSSSGDTELFWALELAGYKIWFDDRLQFQHFIGETSLAAARFINKMYYGTRSEIRLRPYTYLRDPRKLTDRPWFKKHWVWNALANTLPFLKDMSLLHILRFKLQKQVNHKVVRSYVQLGKIVEIIKAGNSDLYIHEKIKRSAWIYSKHENQ